MLTITLVAFEALAVATILPVVARDLGGLRLYGWVFSAFFLGNLLGIVVAGTLADRRGPALPFVAGLVLFATGLAIGGVAPSMLVLVIGRAVQGLGGGAIPAIAYTAIGRTLPEGLRPRMFAVMSTAWVVPGLVGPAVSSLVATHVSWRWVFLGLLPLAAVAALLTVPSLRTISPAGAGTSRRALPDAVLVTVGAGLVLAGLDATASPWRAVPMIVTGAAIAVPALVRLLPGGTLRAAPGLPAAVLARGVLTFAFFGADAYVPLTITDVRGHSVTYAGVTLTAATLAWTTGSWMQARTAATWGGRRLLARGLVAVLLGIGGMAAVVTGALPTWVAVPAWAAAGLGMGLAYPTISVTVLREAPSGREGATTSAMVLSDNLGVALGTGIGGAAVAAGERLSWDPASGIVVAYAIAAAVAVAGVAIGPRFPDATTAKPAGEPAPTS